MTKSQVLAPIGHNSLEHEVAIISIEKPWKKMSKISDVKCILIPMAIPYRLFLFSNVGLFFIPVLAFFYAFILSFMLRKEDIIVARSYFPGLVLCYLKKIKGNKFKFDARSLFVLESTTKGLIKKNSLLYRAWITWEKQILESSELTVAVSEKQTEYYLHVTDKNRKIIQIPCYTSSNNFRYLNRAELLPFDVSDIVIAYYGSLDNGWNNIEIYYSLFQKAIKKGYKICIISQNYSHLKADTRFICKDIFLLDTKVNTNYSDFLQVCDYGVVVMPKISDWETRLSVKFVEYLNNGLGVIVGEYVGEAVRLSKKYFPEHTIIFSETKNEFELGKLTIQSKLELRRRSQKLFGMNNFLKLING
ncbi:hypothetical protein [Pedobacter sp. UYP24]